jgi:hypothetical protein
MTKSKVHIDEKNMYEWCCSTGYLLPSTEPELGRFERLYPDVQIKVNAAAVDPFLIIRGARTKKELSWTRPAMNEQEQGELRMAARLHGELPDHILARIKKNQQKDDTSNRSENSSGNQ